MASLASFLKRCEALIRITVQTGEWRSVTILAGLNFVETTAKTLNTTR